MKQLKTKVFDIASKWHGDQVRKYTGSPYTDHLVSVSEIVEDRGGDPNQVMAALLHDTLEDTNATEDNIINDLTDAGFSKEDSKDITKMVIDLTDVYTHESFPNKNRKERKSLEANRLGKVSERSKFIKCADLIDNGYDIVENDPGFAKTYLKEKLLTLLEMSTIDEEMPSLDGEGDISIWASAYLNAIEGSMSIMSDAQYQKMWKDIKDMLGRDIK